MMDVDTCANCGDPVVFREAPPDLDPSLSYWTHRDRTTNWCYDPTGFVMPDLPYEKRYLKAKPSRGR